jgi:hypothetical protein
MSARSLLAAVVCAAALSGAGASGALAGEVKGPPGDPDNPVLNTNVTQGPSHAASDCVYSGLNDMDTSFGQTDRITQTPKDGPFPGVAGYGCNPVGARP